MTNISSSGWIFNPSSCYQSHAIALFESDIETFPVALRTKTKVILQKDVNNNCRAPTKQKITVSRNIKIGEERICKWGLDTRFLHWMIWDELAFVRMCAFFKLCNTESLGKRGRLVFCCASFMQIPTTLRIYSQIPRLSCWELLCVYRASTSIRKLRGAVAG
jgi:hypothetical protein